jgi:hypothetical protein
MKLRLCIGVLSATLLQPNVSFAQFPASIICQFERIATAELDSDKVVTSSDTSSGDLVLSNLNSNAPIASGNLGSDKLQVLRKSKDTIWLAELHSNAVADGVTTLTVFFKSGILLHTKHETLVGKPFGFVEIGRCKPLK